MPNSRALSLKSPSSYFHRKNLFHHTNNTRINNYKKKRPRTWTCHNRLSTNRHCTISPSVSRWCSQRPKKQKMTTKSGVDLIRDDGDINTNKRQTIATISTLTTNTNSDITTLNRHTTTIIRNHFYGVPENIFHTQSMLFLFGFLFFPCWWIGGYYLKIGDNQHHHPKEILDMEEKQFMTVHPSLLANGKTSSRVFWLHIPVADPLTENSTVALFYKWNRIMSFTSIGLTLCIIGLFIWYCIEYY